MDLLLCGEVLVQDIDDFVDAWHDASQDSPVASQSLEDYLGMTWAEYQLWVEHPESLRFIAAARKARQPVNVVLEKDDRLRLAARADDQSEAHEILQWLIDRGRLENNSRS